MTLGTIRTAVRERLDDPTFDTAKIDRWTNWVLDDVYTRYQFPFMETTTTLDTVDGTQEYAFSSIASDVDKIRSIIDVTNEYTLEYVDPTELDETYQDQSDDAENKPQYWTVRDGSVKLYPIPDDAYTLKVIYKKVPAKLSVASDSPEIPERYSELIVLGVYQKAHEWNDDYDYASVIERQYEQKLMKMINDYKETSGQLNQIPYERPEIG